MGRPEEETHPKILGQLEFEQLFCRTEEEASSPAFTLSMRDGTTGRAARRKVEHVDLRSAASVSNLAKIDEGLNEGDVHAD